MLTKYQSDILKNNTAIKHGFYGKEGGISNDIYYSLNIANYVGDQTEHITENRIRIAQNFDQPVSNLCLLTQIHGDRIFQVTEPLSDTSVEADALITNEPNLILGIQTADCAPVLFADPYNHIIGAAHAGWKGAFLQICKKTIDAMCRIGADKEHIQIAIGPCIQQASYEVDQHFFDQFCSTHANARTFFIDSTEKGHYLFDLPAFIAADLTIYGMQQIDILKMDTYPENTPFFSHRYNTHNDLGVGGRQLSAICLKKP